MKNSRVMAGHLIWKLAKWAMLFFLLATVVSNLLASALVWPSAATLGLWVNSPNIIPFLNDIQAFSRWIVVAMLGLAVLVCFSARKHAAIKTTAVLGMGLVVLSAFYPAWMFAWLAPPGAIWSMVWHRSSNEGVRYAQNFRPELLLEVRPGMPEKKVLELLGPPLGQWERPASRMSREVPVRY